MKRLSTIAAVITCVTVFAYCSGSKKIAEVKTPLVSYQASIQSLVVEKCSPCHIAGKGNKLSLDNYDAMKDNIDDIIGRIEKNPGDRGFMPFKRPKLSDSTIAVFKAWKTDGFAK
jgi:hypothetical protein